jgi:diguanylate cyclase (GGDEF)-like protein
MKIQFQQNIYRYISRLDKKLLSVLIISLVLLIFWGTHLVGPLTPFTHFYIVPIIIAGLFLDITSAFFATILVTVLGTPFLQEAEANFTPFQLWFNLFSDASIFFTILLLTTHLKKVLKELEVQTNYDFLTNACSSRFFIEVSNIELAKSFRDKQPAVVVFIDLDNFKQVNDKYGHQFGDSLLINIVKSIKEILRQNDLLGRMAGDEFAILIQDTSKDQADFIISRIKDNLINSIDHFNTELTFSFGVVIYKADRKINIESLLALADSAMHAVKQNAKTSIKFVFA